ncbi:hypothetical protein BaRGS_00010526 [Batillaria attramentaria]|uniref:Uncharacterized protein n=1 Tax=Batillaria attramentaria TaxID=370345 RepID=A0ABD0LFJ6_9CAEN
MLRIVGSLGWTSALTVSRSPQRILPSITTRTRRRPARGGFLHIDLDNQLDAGWTVRTDQRLKLKWVTARLNVHATDSTTDHNASRCTRRVDSGHSSRSDPCGGGSGADRQKRNRGMVKEPPSALQFHGPFLPVTVEEEEDVSAGNLSPLDEEVVWTVGGWCSI